VKFNSFSGNYYENIHVMRIKIEFAATLIFMLKSLSNHQTKEQIMGLGSSTSINNFQTLDFKHYLVFQVPGNKSKSLRLDCIPLFPRQKVDMESTSVEVEIHPKEWQNRSTTLSRLEKALRHLQEGYLSHWIANNKEKKIFGKIYSSLRFFRRSFHHSNLKEEKVVNLAIAIESLLIDTRVSNIKGEILHRLNKILKHKKGKRHMLISVKWLYEYRNKVVHQGTLDGHLDIVNARKAYTSAVVKIVETTFGRSTDSDTSIARLIGYM
jgi:hypothetical protein